MDQWDTRLARDDIKRVSAVEKRLDTILTQRSSCARRCEALEQRMAALEQTVFGTLTGKIVELAAQVDKLVRIVSKL